VLSTAELLTEHRIDAKQVAAISICNANHGLGQGRRPAGVQRRRLAIAPDGSDLRQLSKRGHGDMVRRKTGLLIDASTTTRYVDSRQSPLRAAKGWARRVAVRTVDSWLVWNLTDRRVHVADYQCRVRHVVRHSSSVLGR
jgi:glycerol kinase